MNRPALARFPLPALCLLAVVGCKGTPAPASVIHMAPDAVTTQLIGEGRLSAAPEFIELTVSVQSECYPTPAAASAATDEAVARVMRLLRAAIDNKRDGDGVFSQGGLTRPFSRYANDRMTCANTFQKATSIIMKSSRLAEFPREFARIQSEIFTGTLHKPARPRSDAGLTFATISTPVPQLTHPSRERLEKEALAAAVMSARAKFTAATSLACKDSAHHIVKFIERDPGAGRPIAYDRSQPSRGGATIEFDAIWINKLIEVHFQIDSPCRG